MEKKKFTTQSLYENLLRSDNDILKNSDVVQVQPIKFKNKVDEAIYRLRLKSKTTN